MSQTPEKKNRFQKSREVQEEFVNGIADAMLSLVKAAGNREKAGIADAMVETPFCPTTGREYGGPNMVRLMLAGIEKGYEDNRWFTLKQLQQYQSEHPELHMDIKKGEYGVKLLRPEEIFFTVDADNKWTYHTQEEARAIEEQRKHGAELPVVQHKTLFYPFTVFNASQVQNFPEKEQPTEAMTDTERNVFVEKFIASAGIAVQHHNGPASYSHSDDLVKMPFPESFANTDDYYAAKLRECYSATGHRTRENRQADQPTLKSQAFEEMRGEMFSMLAGAKLHLPMPEGNAASQIAHWNQKFSGGDVREVFQAASEASRMVTAMRQFASGERPTAWWFPKAEAWPELQNMQKQRDAVVAVSPATHRPGEPAPRTNPPSLAESAEAFKAADDPVAKARLILQNPDFLEMALKQDPNAARELASLCDAMSQALHMELDEKSVIPAPAQQTAPPRMRM